VQMKQAPEDRIPVIVGVGESIDRPSSAAAGLEPLALMAQAARAAAQDAADHSGAALLASVDSLDIVCELSWPYVDAPGRLSALLGMAPRRAVLGPIGGESPIRFLHDAALRIAAGSSEVGLVVGAEAEYTVGLARKEGVALAWEERDPTPVARGVDFMHPQAVLHGVATPATAYQLFENAATSAWNQSPAEAKAESAALWERYAAVAAANPYSWRKGPMSAEEIATPGPQNRMIAFPYPKSMVANPMVNQGAAVLVTSLARARAAGVPEEKLVYFFGGAAADEARDYLERAHLDRSEAQSEVLETVLRDVGGEVSAFSATELYSCFPIVPKIALRILGSDARDAHVMPTVTGGLSFFGAPLNNYMTHAAAAMVRHLRATPNGMGLLYGNGGFMSYHHALVLTAQRSRAGEALRSHYSVQERADARQLPPPAVLEHYEGPATIETFTVFYDRNSAPTHGTVIARTATQQRVLARVPASDAAAIATLASGARSPVGMRGQVAPSVEYNGMLLWRFGPAHQS
jgi:acetyl-CoA C-acetyltransferase